MNFYLLHNLYIWIPKQNWHACADGKSANNSVGPYMWKPVDTAVPNILNFSLGVFEAPLPALK